MKKIIVILTLALFTLSTLVMPYANFDDTRSLQAVYNNCLKQDADMDFIEFVGEKLLVAGFDPTEAGEKNKPCRQHPVPGSLLVQIQSGVLYQHKQLEIQLLQPETEVIGIPLRNTAIPAHADLQGIFHPPVCIAC